MIENLFVFDFDDTLATTIARIGVARLYKGENDELFRSWLSEHDLYPVDEKTQNKITYFYLPSEDFAKYQKFASENITEDVTELFDFGDTSGVREENVEANEKIIKILQAAENSPNSRVIVVTARSAGNIDTPFGKVKSTNREDIANFLSGVGSSVNQSQIFPVGSSNPADKVTIVKRYIEALFPKTVHFFDDNELNLAAMHQLCDELKGVPNIVTHKVENGTAKKDKEC